MLSRLLDPTNGKPRDRVFWLVLAAVISVQLLALYSLCSQQVRKAEARQAAAHAERLANSDCLQTLAGVTVVGCDTRTRPSTQVMGAGGRGVDRMPGYVLR